jgi:hypothetical protein
MTIRMPVAFLGGEGRFDHRYHEIHEKSRTDKPGTGIGEGTGIDDPWERGRDGRREGRLAEKLMAEKYSLEADAISRSSAVNASRTPS